jgi:transcription elongation factor GreB
MVVCDMSKAFTRESDDAPESGVTKRPGSLLPPGARNYFTPTGLEKLRREMESLPDSAASRQRRLEIKQALEGAVAVPPPAPPFEQVFFGATIRVRDQGGEENRYRIVGAYEMDLDRNWISHLSPLARALLKGRRGETVRFRAPAGEQFLQILEISCE